MTLKTLKSNHLMPLHFKGWKKQGDSLSLGSSARAQL